MNAKIWEILFWVVTVLLFVSMITLFPAAFANDCRVEKKVDDFKDRVANDLTEIKTSMARIEGAVIRRENAQTKVPGM